MDTSLKIINYLGKHIGDSFTMHGLSKAIRIPYATFHRTIQKMDNIININVVGQSKTISLNRDNTAIKSYLVISSEEEKKQFLNKQPVLNKITSELRVKDIVILFGSYAKGTQKEDSDIDLLIINKKGDKSISFSKYEILYKVKIHPLFITKQEFVYMLHEDMENVGKQALKEHIILQNPENFWGCVLDG